MGSVEIGLGGIYKPLKLLLRVKMVIENILLKIQHNKKNNQLSMLLPRKKLGIDKKRVPKEILVVIKKLKFMEDLDG